MLTEIKKVSMTALKRKPTFEESDRPKKKASEIPKSMKQKRTEAVVIFNEPSEWMR